MPPTGSRIIAGSGRQASTGWRTTCRSCRRRRSPGGRARGRAAEARLAPELQGSRVSKEIQETFSIIILKVLDICNCKNLLIGGDVSRDDPEAKQGAVPAGPVSSPVTREPREISRQALRPVRGVELIGSHVQSRGDP